MLTAWFRLRCDNADGAKDGEMISSPTGGRKKHQCLA